MSIKFAIIGCGRISKRHADILGNKAVSGVALVSICDVEKSKSDFPNILSDSREMINFTAICVYDPS